MHGQPIDGMTVWYKRSLGQKCDIIVWNKESCLNYVKRAHLVTAGFPLWQGYVWYTNFSIRVSILFENLQKLRLVDLWIGGWVGLSDWEHWTLCPWGEDYTSATHWSKPMHKAPHCTLHTAYETLHNTHCPTGPSQCIAQCYTAKYTLHTACNAVTQWKHCEANPLMLSVLWFGLPRNIQQIWAFLIETILDSSG